jgi:N-acetylmuramoyl-L-alanine amidase
MPDKKASLPVEQGAASENKDLLLSSDPANVFDSTAFELGEGRNFFIRPARVNKNVGRTLTDIFGLSIHTVDSVAPNPKFGDVFDSMLGTWAKSGYVSAHFGIDKDGNLAQFVSQSRIAFAQGDPGDRNWISVEVFTGKLNVATCQTDTLEDAQIETLQVLMNWLNESYNVPIEIGTAYIGQDKVGIGPSNVNDYVSVGKAIAAQRPNTRKAVSDLASASQTRGISCHYWLGPKSHVKACPGLSILTQLPRIVGGPAIAMPVRSAPKKK